MRATADELLARGVALLCLAIALIAVTSWAVGSPWPNVAIGPWNFHGGASSTTAFTLIAAAFHYVADLMQHDRH